MQTIHNWLNEVLKCANLGSIQDYDIPLDQGLMSIVLFPKGKQNEVLKVPRPDKTPDAFKDEIRNFELLKNIDFESVDVVRAREIGHNPNYIRMNRLGPTLGSLWKKDTPSVKEIIAVGNAIGDFVVEFHKKTGGLVHCDIHFKNLTRQPDERFGVLDMDNIHHGDYESAFAKLAVQRPNVIPIASERIRQLTGKGLNPFRLREVIKLWERYPEQMQLALENVREFESAIGMVSEPMRTSTRKKFPTVIAGLDA